MAAGVGVGVEIGGTARCLGVNRAGRTPARPPPPLLSPPPDLDCGEITHRRFTVLPPDPHGFDGDGDGDGVGCESG